MSKLGIVANSVVRGHVHHRNPFPGLMSIVKSRPFNRIVVFSGFLPQKEGK